MKRVATIIIIGVIALGTGIGFRYSTQQSKSPLNNLTTVPVKKGEFIISLQDTGVIKAKQSSTVIVPEMRRSWGDLKITKLVPEGSKVKAGDPVCWFENAELERQFKQVEYQVQRNEAELEKNEESKRLQRENRSRIMKSRKLDWDAAKLELELETKKYEKYKRLVSEEILPQQDLDDEERSHRMAVLRTDQAEKEYLKAAEQEATDEKLKEIELERTKSQSEWYLREYEELKEGLDQSVLFAPTNGLVIYAKNWRSRQMQAIKEGDTIRRGNQVVLIPDLSEIQVMTQIDETDLSKVKLGMPVRIKMDSIPDLVMTGKITQIGNLAIERERSLGSGQVSTEQSSGIKVFEITVDLDGTNEQLRPGMTCRVDIILDTVPDAIYIPLKAIHSDQGKKYILEKNHGKLERRDVKFGRQNKTDVIILEGLNPNEEIILPEEES